MSKRPTAPDYDWIIPDDVLLVGGLSRTGGDYMYDTHGIPDCLDIPDCLVPGWAGYTLYPPDRSVTDQYHLFWYWPEMDVRAIVREVEAVGGTILWPGDVLPNMNRDVAEYLEDWVDDWQGRGKLIDWEIPEGTFLESDGVGAVFFVRDGRTPPTHSSDPWPPIKETYAIMNTWKGMNRKRIAALVEADGRHVLWPGDILPNCAPR
jgi:hypothetical protein